MCWVHSCVERSFDTKIEIRVEIEIKVVLVGMHANTQAAEWNVCRTLIVFILML